MKTDTAKKSKIDTHAEGDIVYIQENRILEHDDIQNRKLDKGAVDELVTSILSIGLLQPLVVWNGGSAEGEVAELENGKRVPASFIIAGNHRLAAIRKIKVKHATEYSRLFGAGVPCIVRGGEIKDALMAKLAENKQRLDETAQETYKTVHTLLEDHNVKAKEIAKAVGKTPGWVSQVSSIEEELGDEGAEAIQTGKVKFSHAREAAAESKKQKKAGKTPDKKKLLEEAVKKSAKKKAKKGEPKKLSAPKVYERYAALPTLKQGAKLVIAEAALAYLAGESEELPDELSSEE